MNTQTLQDFDIGLATTPQDVQAAQRLRYDVFVRELGGEGHLVDHDAHLEQDIYDAYADHMIVRHGPDRQVVGVYRLMTQTQANLAGQFYSETEYDLSVLKHSNRRILELGRSCIHKDFRTGLAMHRLWMGLAEYIDAHDIDLLFGVASFQGTNAQRLAEPLSLLHHRHLAPKSLRVRAHADAFQAMDLIDAPFLDRRRAIMQMPALIKAYLRLGGCVGEGAFVDHAFNTTDVCLILDLKAMNAKQARLYRGQST